ncbi:homocysteine S-methyltransferase 3-like [Rhincodon typus]|uniref:homocysteine S-methyltransferase 3-like n=1 Tax=Rhincodon typus TaxID=259920 RepID=UPI00202E3F50|nr:homocysteine S-methyltransferase 3-like [Rhincodon typus]
MEDRPEVTIIDGGLATELEAGGLNLQDDPLWSARILQTNPQAIKDVHTRYLSSGADVITTATYQATLAGFVKYLGLKSEEAALLLQSGVYIAKEAVAEFLSESRSSGKSAAVVDILFLTIFRLGFQTFFLNKLRSKM